MRLAILGASGHGKVAAEIAYKSGWENIVFFDQQWPELTHLCHWEVKGNEDSLVAELSSYDGVFIAIGNNEIRQNKFKQLSQLNAKIINLVAPSAVMSNMVNMGRGVLVTEGACVNADTLIGDGVIINTGATVDHDCQLDDFVHVSPGVNLAGNICIGQLTLIGIGSSVIQGVRIGTQVIAGAGSVIIRNIPDNVTVVGVPAKIIK